MLFANPADKTRGATSSLAHIASSVELLRSSLRFVTETEVYTALRRGGFVRRCMHAYMKKHEQVLFIMRRERFAGIAENHSEIP